MVFIGVRHTPDSQISEVCMKELGALCFAAIFALLFGGIIVWIENRREHDWWEDFEK